MSQGDRVSIPDELPLVAFETLVGVIDPTHEAGDRPMELTLEIDLVVRASCRAPLFGQAGG